MAISVLMRPDVGAPSEGRQTGVITVLSDLVLDMTNDTLKTARLSLRLSQEEFARRLRDAGRAVGEPNDASAPRSRSRP